MAVAGLVGTGPNDDEYPRTHRVNRAPANRASREKQRKTKANLMRSTLFPAFLRFVDARPAILLGVQSNRSNFPAIHFMAYSHYLLLESFSLYCGTTCRVDPPLKFGQVSCLPRHPAAPMLHFSRYTFSPMNILK